MRAVCVFIVVFEPEAIVSLTVCNFTLHRYDINRDGVEPYIPHTGQAVGRR